MPVYSTCTYLPPTTYVPMSAECTLHFQFQSVVCACFTVNVFVNVCSLFVVYVCLHSGYMYTCSCVSGVLWALHLSVDVPTLHVCGCVYP